MARVFQGLGAAMITPQTMAIITRIFPSERRGQAMALWGATAGVATLVGPILGGVLVDALGWEWIFFINMPVGMVGFVLAWRLVPSLPTHTHSFDWLGVALSGVGMFLLVFGIQEGHQYDWGTITGIDHGARADHRRHRRARGVRRLAGAQPARAAGAAAAVPRPQLQPRQRGDLAMGFAITAMAFPIMLYAQLVRGLLADPGGAAAGADGGDVDRAGAVGRQAHRRGAPARDHRLRLRRCDRLADLAVAAR